MDQNSSNKPEQDDENTHQVGSIEYYELEKKRKKRQLLMLLLDDDEIEHEITSLSSAITSVTSNLLKIQTLCGQVVNDNANSNENTDKS